MFALLEQQRMDRDARQVSGVHMLEIDYFKVYNDTFGHLAGDDCLRRLSAAMRAFGDKSGLDFFRYGGEEFLALYYEDQTLTLLQLAEELRRLVWELKIPFPGSLSQRITVSVGYALAQQYSGVVDERLNRMADDALYGAKAPGRNQSKAYTIEVGYWKIKEGAFGVFPEKGIQKIKCAFVA